MRKFKFIPITLLIVLLTGCGSDNTPSLPKPAPETEAVVVLIENGATVSAADQPAMITTTLNLFQQLSALGRRAATRDAQIHLIFTANPNRIAWSGTPRQLQAQATEVKSLLQFTSGFSDLGISFEQIQTTLKLTQPDHVRLYWLGPVINVPFQNSHGEITIELPQAIPDLALPSFVDQLTHLKIYGVHADQRSMLQNYLSTHGILQRAASGALDFSLLGMAQTKANLTDLL